MIYMANIYEQKQTFTTHQNTNRIPGSKLKAIKYDYFYS